MPGSRYTTELSRACTHLVTLEEPTPLGHTPLRQRQNDTNGPSPRSFAKPHQHADPSIKMALAVHNCAKWRTRIVGADWVAECARRRVRLIEAHFTPPLCSKEAADAVTAAEMARARAAASAPSGAEPHGAPRAPSTAAGPAAEGTAKILSGGKRSSSAAGLDVQSGGSAGAAGQCADLLSRPAFAPLHINAQQPSPQPSSCGKPASKVGLPPRILD